MESIIYLIVGLIIGIIIAIALWRMRKKDLLNAISKNSEEVIKLAHEVLKGETRLGEKELEGKKALIDQSLDLMREELENVQNIIREVEKDREHKFGELANQLKNVAEETSKLEETTDHLRMTLSSSRKRGEWGERIAEDIIKLAGFIEGINYEKQKVMDSVSTRPDYTFFLPQNLKVNMDVKFSLDNYVRYAESDNETDKERHKSQFLKDIKNRIKDVTTRDYINPQENTLDYVLVFIPNEHIYSFIHENDRTIIDEALRSKVILCSPLTLYAVLAVIRQAVDNFNLERTASEILSLLGAFNKQWSMFLKSLEKVGKKIEEAQEEFESLSTTRRNQLERPLRQIEEMRRQKGVDINLMTGEIPPESSDIEDDKNPGTI